MARQRLAECTEVPLAHTRALAQGRGLSFRRALVADGRRGRGRCTRVARRCARVAQHRARVLEGRVGVGEAHLPQVLAHLPDGSVLRRLCVLLVRGKRGGRQRVGWREQHGHAQLREHLNADAAREPIVEHRVAHGDEPLVAHAHAERRARVAEALPQRRDRRLGELLRVACRRELRQRLWLLQASNLEAAAALAATAAAASIAATAAAGTATAAAAGGSVHVHLVDALLLLWRLDYLELGAARRGHALDVARAVVAAALAGVAERERLHELVLHAADHARRELLDGAVVAHPIALGRLAQLWLVALEVVALVAEVAEDEVPLFGPHLLEARVAHRVVVPVLVGRAEAHLAGDDHLGARHVRLRRVGDRGDVHRARRDVRHVAPLERLDLRRLARVLHLDTVLLAQAEGAALRHVAPHPERA
mmetsp:Transcript_7908/g.23377  ORF Transcript_7908/g.23377 Transcript_7908/m.23377 type:complete len:422 (+) Transcript_7908:702-1967(+)